MIPSNLRISLIIILFLYFLLILYFLKKKAISLKYTLLWIIAGIMMGVMLIWPRLLTILIHIIGIESNMNGLFVLAIGFLIMILMSITSIVSKQSERIKTLAQTIAILEKKIRDQSDESNSN